MDRLLAALAGNAIEASALAIVVACLCRIAVRKRPILGAPLRHLLWLLVLAKLIAPPVVRIPWPLGWIDELTSGVEPAAPATSAAELPAVAAFERDGGEPSALEPAPLEIQAVATVGAGDAAEEVLTASLEISPAGEPARSFLSPDASGLGGLVFLRPLAAWGWGIGSLVFAAVQIGGIVAFARRLRRSEPAPASITSLCARVAERMGLRRPPQTRVLGESISPLVWALGRPVVVIPRSLVQAMDDASLRPLLAHELAHLRRGDHFAVWLDLAVGCVAWWVPTYWWARREAERAGDEACDARAVAALGDRKEYAETLLSTLEVLSAQEMTPLPAVGRGLGEREVVARRLTMIVRGPMSHRVSAGGWLVVALLALIVLPVSTLKIAGQEAAPIPPVLPAPPAPSSDASASPVHPVLPAVLPAVPPDDFRADPPRPGATGAVPVQPRQPIQAPRPGFPIPPAPPNSGLNVDVDLESSPQPSPAGRGRGSRSRTSSDPRGVEGERARIGRETNSTAVVWEAESGDAPGDPMERRLLNMEDRLEAMLAELRAIRRERAVRPRTVAPAGAAIVVEPPSATAARPARRARASGSVGRLPGASDDIYGRPGTIPGQGAARDRAQAVEEIQKEIDKMKRDFEERMAALRRDQEKALRLLRDSQGEDARPWPTPARQ